MHHFNKGIARINLEIFLGKIGRIGAFVVVVLKKFAQHQEVKWQRILAMVIIFVIGITIFMPAPVYDCTMHRAHEPMDWQQQEHPPMRGEMNVKQGIKYPKRNPCYPGIAKFIKKGPFGIVTAESWLRFNLEFCITYIDIFGLHGHAPDILEKVWGMRILFCITIGMVHTVHDGICTWIEKRGSLSYEGGEIEKSLPALAHREHFVGSVTVQEKSLEEQGDEPVAEKEYKNRHF